MRFSSVTAPGDTTLEPVNAASLNLTLPGGFAISNTSSAFEIHTTATVATPIEVCLVAVGMNDADFAAAAVLHGVGGAWQVETTRRDSAARTLCADVSSLSPFAVGVRVDVTAPQVTCAPADALWHGSNVTLACTASDQGSGLRSPADASFGLSTSVAAGTESATAVTGSRQVCDALGNCATAGPIGGLKIDLRSPSIAIAAPGATRFILGAAAVAAYTCTDAGSGVATCTGTVSSGSPLDTSVVGPQPFAVVAADRAGNSGAGSVTYTVGYGVKALYDQTRAFKLGSAISLDFALVDAAGRNVSSSAIAVATRKITRVSDGAALDVVYAVPYLAKTKSYGGKLPTTGLRAGTYEVEFMAGNDPAPQRLRFTVR